MSEWGDEMKLMFHAGWLTGITAQEVNDLTAGIWVLGSGGDESGGGVVHWQNHINRPPSEHLSVPVRGLNEFNVPYQSIGDYHHSGVDGLTADVLMPGCGGAELGGEVVHWW